MKAQRKNKLVFISAFVSTLDTEQNLVRHEELGMSLGSDFKYKEVIGKYSNKLEKSYMVLLENDSDLRVLQSLANHFEQECILHVDELNDAVLLFPSGEATEIGNFRQVTRYYAELQGDFTYDPEFKTFYKAV